MSLAEQSLASNYSHFAWEPPVADDDAEYVVPVQWLVANPREQAYWERGMFAKQHRACKLRQEFTLDRLAKHFGVDEGDSGG